MTARPFRVLGVQQIAIGGPSKAALRGLWVDLLGVVAEGSFRSEREVGVLTADGRFSQGGRLIAELDADGLVHVPAQPPGKTIRVDPDGTVLVDDDVVWAIGEDGQIHSRGKDGVLTNDGLAVFDGPPESRRAIALLMALQLMSRPSASASASTTTSSAPPAPAPVPRIP